MPARRDIPWLTAAVAIAAVVPWLSPAASAALLLEHAAVERGELWRLWSGHLVHFGGSHLAWNLAVWLPAAGWLERHDRRRLAWFLAAAPAAVAVALHLLQPGMAAYGGLSGLAAGVVVLLALDRIAGGEARAAWGAALGLVAVKIGLEFVRADAVFANLPDGVRTVPLAHLAGVAAAVAVFVAGREKKKLR